MVPEGWKEQHVKDLVTDLNAGVSVNSEDDGNENATHKILKTSCVSHDYFKSDETKSVIAKSEIMRLREPVMANSIIISRMNTPALVGANAYVEASLDNTYLPDRLWQIRPRDKVVDMRWLAYWFGSAHTRYRLSNLGTGTSGSMKNITKLDVLNLTLLTPPLPEQKKIAQVLSTWDKAVTTTEQLLANSQQQKKALMQQLLTGKKRLLDENGVRFSGEWQQCLLGDIATITTGKSNRQDSNLNGTYTFFDRSVDVRTSDSYLFDSEAIIVPGEGQDFVPKYFVGKFDLHQRTYAIMDFPLCHGKFLFYLIHHLRAYFLSQAVGSTVKSLRLPMFQKMTLKLPALPEQHKIASVLSSADDEIAAIQQKLEVLKQEKKALMQQLLTGKRRVTVN